MAAKQRKKQIFSKVKAVKSNARDLVGQPKPERAIEGASRNMPREQKHKPTLQELINKQD